MNDLQIMALIGLGVVGVATAGIFYEMIGSRHAPLQRLWRDYVVTLEREIRLVFWRTTGPRLAMLQIVAGVAIIAAAALLEDAAVLLLLFIVALAPRALLSRTRRKRVERLEHQIDGWLLLLANMLKATSSLGDAIRASLGLVRPPLAQDIDLVVKELQLGTPVDQSLGHMSARLQSRIVSSAVTTLVIGRRTGGDLPHLLETAAAALRELVRLEGVVRAKTAEGRAQITVLVLLPVAIVALFHWIEPGYFQPLLETEVGNILVGVALALWILSFIVAQRILAVDL